MNMDAFCLWTCSWKNFPQQWKYDVGQNYCANNNKNNNNNNSVALVCERTIPTERLPLVGEVSANFRGYRVSRGQRDWSLRPYSRLSKPEPLLSLPSSSSVVLTRLSDHVPDPLLLRKSGSAGNLTQTSGSVARNSDH
jgi:hypothetical protein